MTTARSFNASAKEADISENNPLYERIVRDFDGDALSEFYRAEKRKLHSFAYKFLLNDEMAEDCVQDVFTKIFHMLSLAKKGEETRLCDTGRYFRTWTHTLIKNTAFDMLALHANRQSDFYDTVNEFPDEGFGQWNLPIERSLDSPTPPEYADPLVYLVSCEQHMRQQMALEKIYKTAQSDLSTWMLLESAKRLSSDKGNSEDPADGLSYQEIAGLHQKTLGTVKKRIHIARQNLVGTLEPDMFR